MKITYLFNGRLPTEKAHGVQIAKMCEAFAMTGQTVTLIAAYRKNLITENIFSFYALKKNFVFKRGWGVDLSFLPGRASYYIQTVVSGFLVTLNGLLYKTDVYYTRDYWTLFFLWVFRKSTMAEIHDYRPVRPRWYIKKGLLHSRTIITNSNGTKEVLLTHYPELMGRIMVMPNGVDLNFFDVAQDQVKAREQLHLPTTGPIIGYIGRLETVGLDKGVGLLIESMRLVIQSYSQAVLCVIGGPDKAVHAYEKKLNSDEKKQMIFTGQVRYADIPLYFRAIDVAVIPFPDTRQFAMTASPIKVFESMAAGKAIVATDLPTLRTYLHDCALFFKPGDVKDLANKIIVAMQKSMSDLLGQAAQERAKEYSWEQRAQYIIDKIHE